MYAFGDATAKRVGMDLLMHQNPEGLVMNISALTHGSAPHIDILRTECLRQAQNPYKFDAAFGGARREDVKSCAEERVFSLRSTQQRWDPKRRRSELWQQAVRGGA